MRNFLKRLGRVLWLSLKPIPDWGDAVQRIITLILFVAPTLGAVIDKYTGSGYHWTLTKGLVASFGLFAIAQIVSAYRIHKQLDEVIDGAPKLVWKGISFHQNAISGPELSGSPPVPTGNMVIIGTPVFYHLHIVNEPTSITDRKIAEKVAGRVQIFHENGTPAANERLHRWEDSPAPNDPQVGKLADSMIPRDMSPSGVEYKLDHCCPVKSRTESVGWGFR